MLESLEKLLPTRKDCEEQRHKPVKTLKRSMFPAINGGDEDSPLAMALDLHAPKGDKSEKVEIKNENWQKLEVGPLSPYKRLIHLNLSMNKIGAIAGAFDCPLLQTLSMSDNQLKELSPHLLAKCGLLKTLTLDLNQFRKIANMEGLYSLEELSLANNQL